MSIGIPYAHANEDGSKTCPACGERCFDVDETQETSEDAMTKGSGMAYALHFENAHAERINGCPVIWEDDAGSKITRHLQGFTLYHNGRDIGTWDDASLVIDQAVALR